MSEGVDHQERGDEIDLAEIIRQLWAGRKVIIITACIFVVFGIGYSLFKSRKVIPEYQSRVTLFVESPSADSLLKVFTYPPFFSGLMNSSIGLDPSSVVSVRQVLDRQTPPQGSVASLMSRVTAVKGDANTLIIHTRLQDPALATQLGECVIRELIEYLPSALETRVELVIRRLKEDSLKNILQLTENIDRSRKYAIMESTRSIQALTKACSEAEQAYLQSQIALEEFYRDHAVKDNLGDSLEVARLNADINLKYGTYSSFYSQLNHAKLEAGKQDERLKIDAGMQIERAGTEVSKQIELVRRNAEKQQPEITVLEPATGSSPVEVENRMKIPLISLFLGLIAGIGMVYGMNFYRKNFSRV